MADNKNIRLTLKDVRGSFLHLIEPQERRNDDGKLTGYVFNGNFLVDKIVDGQTNPVAAEIADASKRVIEARWPGQNKKIPATERCFIDGEPKDEDTGKPEPLYDGYAGKYVLKANNGVTIEDWEERRKNPVQLLGPRKGADGKFPRLRGSAAEELFYSGAYFDIVVSIWAYDGSKKGHKNRVSCTLEVVKFKRHGEAFGAAPINAEDFLDEEADDELSDDGIGSGDSGAAAGGDDLLGGDDDLLAT